MSAPGDDALARGLSDTALLALGSVLGALFGLLSLRLLLTSLSEDDYGRYCLFQAVAGALSVLLYWPAPAALRLGAEEMERRGRVGRALGSVLALVAASAAPVCLAAALLGERLDALVGHPSWALALGFALLSALAQVAYCGLSPAGRVGLRTLLPAAARGAYAGLLGLVVLGQGSVDLHQALVLCAAAALPPLVLGLLALEGRLGSLRPARGLVARAASFGGPVLVRNLAVTGVLYVDVLVVQALLGRAEAGRYDVAYRVSEQVVVFGLVLEFVVGPALATAAARRDPAALGRFYRLLAPQLALAWCLLAALLVVLAEPALVLLGAKSAAASARVLELLGLAVALRGVMALELAVFDAHLVSLWPTVCFFLGFLLNLGGDVLLVRAGWGLSGPALATCAGFALQAALRAGHIGRRFGVPARRPYLAVLVVVAVLAIHRLGGGSPLVGLLAWVAALALALLAGPRLGLFPAEARPYLARIRMPAPLRTALERLHASEAA